MSRTLRRRDVIWVSLDPVRGREQLGRRPAVVIATNDYLEAVTDLAIVVPVTTRDRGWPHHVFLSGPHLRLDRDSFAMTEQPRTIARERILGQAGEVDDETAARIDLWLGDFLLP